MSEKLTFHLMQTLKTKMLDLKDNLLIMIMSPHSHSSNMYKPNLTKKIGPLWQLFWVTINKLKVLNFNYRNYVYNILFIDNLTIKFQQVMTG